MDAKLLLRLALVVFLLWFFYSQGVPEYVVLLLGAVFAIFLLFRDKLWKGTEKLLEEKLPFTKRWPRWARWAVVFIGFFAVYYVLKLIIYSVLAGLGFDVQGEMLKALNASS
ncbi:MAG: hypothetical protein ABIF01_03410 [Candidatus Micrarchaeota archaeon]